LFTPHDGTASTVLLNAALAAKPERINTEFANRNNHKLAAILSLCRVKFDALEFLLFIQNRD
jgi:proline dehydrogenase